MTRVCLDTSAYTHFKRGHAPVVELVSSARRVHLPAVVIGELRAGFLLGSQLSRNEAELREFLAQPVVDVQVVDQEAAAHFAELIVALRRAGTPLPTNDVWIAALGARDGATVITYDAHFGRISGLALRLLAV